VQLASLGPDRVLPVCGGDYSQASRASGITPRRTTAVSAALGRLNPTDRATGINDATVRTDGAV